MKRQRKKYLRPAHPWEKERMDAEDKLLNKHGLGPGEVGDVNDGVVEG